MSDEHVKPATNAEAKVQVAGMLEIQDNKMCFDCPNRNPTWASLTFAVFLCEPCCGRHRGMGTHITFMRSVRLDEWEPEQAYRMSFGGNGPARKFFKQHGIMEVQDKYQTTAALQYRKQLDKLVKGRASTWETQKAESPVGSNSASPLSPDEASPSATGMASPVMLSGEGASSPVQRRPNLASKKKGKGLGGAKKVDSSAVKLATTATAVPEGFLPAQKKEVPKDEPIDLTQQAREREQQDNSANPYASLQTDGSSHSKPAAGASAGGGGGGSANSPSYEATTTDYAKSFEAPQTKGRFYGIGSAANAVQNDTTQAGSASPVYVPTTNSSMGPDYSGFGSTPLVREENNGMDLTDAAQSAAESFSKAKDWLSGKSESVGGSIKNFLDEL